MRTKSICFQPTYPIVVIVITPHLKRSRRKDRLERLDEKLLPQRVGVRLEMAAVVGQRVFEFGRFRVFLRDVNEITAENQRQESDVQRGDQFLPVNVNNAA